jgi:hypothetical protein
MQSFALSDGVSPGFRNDGVCYSSLTASRDLADESPILGSCAHVVESDDGPNHLSAVSPPSEQELVSALSMASHLDFSNPSECFRVLIAQNSVILRDAIYRRQLVARVSNSSSLGSPLASSSSGLLSSSGSSSSAYEVGNGIIKQSPPKLFQCPICLHMLNEKDFDRHVFSWIGKSHKVSPVKSGRCAGIRDSRHPLLQQFPHGTLSERVVALVTDIRSYLRPGAYDAMGPQGSGRHVSVAQRLQFLMTSS